MNEVNRIVDDIHLKLSKYKITVKELSSRTGINHYTVKKVLEGSGKVEALKSIIDEVNKIVEEKNNNK